MSNPNPPIGSASASTASTPPGGVPPTGGSPPPSGIPTNQPKTALETAQRLIALKNDMVKIKEGDGAGTGSLDGAIRGVNSHRTGMMDDPDSWKEFNFQRARLNVALCDAVGVSSGIPNYMEEARQAAKDAGKDPDKALIVPSRHGEFAKRDWTPFIPGMVNTPTKINVAKPGEKESRHHVDPDATDFDKRVARKLDETAKETLKALKAEHEAALKAGEDQNNPSAFQQRAITIQELEEIVNDKNKSFRKFIESTEEAAFALDRHVQERNLRDRGVSGGWNTNRHSEENPENMALIGDLAARFGCKIPSLAVITGFDSPRFKVIARKKYDPETGKPHVSAEVIHIPLFSEKGAQFAAAQLVGSFYEPLYLGKQKMQDKMIDQIDPKTGKVVKVPEIDKATGKVVKEVVRGANGKPVMERLSPEERRDLIKNNEFPLGSLPPNFPDHSIRFFMDLLAQNIAMGGNGFCGFNPAAIDDPSLGDVFDLDAIDQICSDSGMFPGVKAAFKDRLMSHVRTHWQDAQNRQRDNILIPGIYRNAQNDEKFALQRVLIAEGKKTAKDFETKRMTQAEYDIFIKQNPGYEAKVKAMQKKPLDKGSFMSSSEREMALKHHENLPPDVKKLVEEDISITRVCDRDDGILAPAKREDEVIGDDKKEKLETDVMNVTSTDEPETGISMDLEDLSAAAGVKMVTKSKSDSTDLGLGVDLDATLSSEDRHYDAESIPDSVTEDIEEILTFVDPAELEAIKTHLQAHAKNPDKLKNILRDLKAIEKQAQVEGKAGAMLARTIDNVTTTKKGVTQTTKVPNLQMTNTATPAVVKQRQERQAELSKATPPKHK